MGAHVHNPRAARQVGQRLPDRPRESLRRHDRGTVRNKIFQGAPLGAARRAGTPLLGTCGGFQHIVIEYARNVLGLTDADHAESNPYASRLVVTPLTCSLAGQRLDVDVRPGSVAFQLTGPRLTENYYCNFGLNPEYQDALDRAGLRIAATSADGEVRIMELPGHPFFMGTLFVPQASSTPEQPHPLVTGFLKAALQIPLV